MYQPLLLLLTYLTPVWSIPSFESHDQQPLDSTSAKPKPKIPRIGLGLWNSNGTNATNAVKYALKAGYRHLDSAAAYSNEQYVGLALNSTPSSPPRHKIWITSKLWNTAHRPTDVASALNQTLQDLNTTYLDLYLMHWPIAFLPNQGDRNIVDSNLKIEDTWTAMEALVSKNLTHPEPGTTRYIGISNFSPREIDRILAVATVQPYVHEFETHPWLQQSSFVDWHAKNNITVIAYSPLANSNPTYNGTHTELGKILDDPFWCNMSSKKNVTVAQAILGWGLARGTVVIPKSTNESHIRENLGAVRVNYTSAEFEEIAAQDKKARFNNPGTGWGVSLFEGLDDGPDVLFAAQELR